MLAYSKIFVPCHQRVTSAEENLNTQVDRMTHSVDTSQLFFPATLSLPNELMNRVAVVAGTQVMHALSNMDFHSPRSTWLWLLNAQYDNWNNQHCLQCYHFSGSSVTWWQVDYTGPLSAWKKRYVLARIYTYSGLWICFSWMECFCQNYYPWACCCFLVTKLCPTLSRPHEL